MKSKHRKETKYLGVLFSFFSIHIALILLNNFQLIPLQIYGRIAYIFNLSYAPLLFLYLSLNSGISRPWLKKYLYAWIGLGILAPMFQLGKTVYDGLIILSFTISILAIFIPYFKSDHLALSSWNVITYAFLLVLGLTFTFELSFTPQSFRSLGQMRFIYFSSS